MFLANTLDWHNDDDANYIVIIAFGAALFHLKTKAVLIFSVGTLDDDGNMTISFELVEVDKKPSVESITQAYTKMLELKISEFPDHYFWFHKKWKSDYS